MLKTKLAENMTKCILQVVCFFSGICPQHNVLFDNLTVQEHLWFFTSLKGNYTEGDINSQVDRMIAAIGLEEKRYFRSKGLSGGMKRKLSVGIALVGDSKV